MSDQNNNNNNNNNQGTDSTSFTSILANVQKLREQQQQHEIPSSYNIQHTRTLPSSTNKKISSTKRPIISTDKQPSTKRQSSSLLKINKNQTGNPLLNHLNNISWEYVSKHNTYDYLIPSIRPVIFLSLKYHKLHPEHLPMKLKANKSSFSSSSSSDIPIVLVYVDVERYDNIIEELNYLSVYDGFTLLLGWGWEECAFWLKSLVLNK